jgi:hypothetical protein
VAQEVVTVAIQETFSGTNRGPIPRRLCFIFVFASLIATAAQAQLDGTCTVSILNRSARVDGAGFWVIPDAPANQGPVRARATCVSNGVTRSGQSDLITVPVNGRVESVAVSFGAYVSVPARMTLSAPSTIVAGAAAPLQLVARVTYPSGDQADVTSAGSGTTYTTSNPLVGTVSANGLVTAVSSGPLIIGAMNDGALALIKLNVASSVDSDGDGMPDDWEIANGLNPHDPSDALLDPDGDGLSNLEEYRHGTDPHKFDTDGDGISDGLEIRTGSDPLDPNSYNLAKALASLEVRPSDFQLVFNTAAGEVSQQLQLIGHLIDSTNIDLTARSRGTNYTSSDLSIASLGATDGLIFAGTNGTASIVITNSGFTATAHVTVNSFVPAGLSALQLPGRVERIRVRNGFAYIAAGPAGLIIVDVHDPLHPAIVGTLHTPGLANDLVVEGGRAYIADDTSLQIIDVTNPAVPRLLGALSLPGEVMQLGIDGTTLWIACHTAGLVSVDVSNPESAYVAGAISFGNVDLVTVRDGLAYVIADGVLGIYDVSRRSAPRQLGSMYTSSSARHLVVSGNTLYIAAYDQGLYAIDVTDPANPRELGSVGGAGIFVPADLAVVGNAAIISDVYYFDSIPIVNVANPASMQFQSVIDLTSFGDYDGHGVDADGQYAYVVAQNFRSGASALLIAQHSRVIDDRNLSPQVSIAAPVSTTLVRGQHFTLKVNATDDVAVAAVHVTANGADSYASVAPFTFRLSAPQSGTLTIFITATDFGGRTTQTTQTYTVVDDVTTSISGAVKLANGTAVSGITVRSIVGNATTDVAGRYTITGVPSTLGTVSVHATAHRSDGPYSGTATVTAVTGSPAPLDAADLVLNNIAGLRGIQTNIGGYPNAMKVRDGLAYIATGAYGLQIVDTADPRLPLLVAGVDTPGNANGIALAGNVALIADGGAGLQRIDVTQPWAPRINATLALPAPALEVAASAQVAAVALGTGGLALVDYQANPPALLGTTQLGEVRSVVFDGSLLVALTATEVVTLSVSNPAAPSILGRVALNDYWTLEATNRTVLAADLSVQIATIDVRTPAAPVIVRTDSDNWVRRATMLNTYVFDAASNNFIQVRDTRPSAPQTYFLGIIYGLAGSAVAVDSDFAYEAGAIDQITDRNPHPSFDQLSRFAVVPHNLLIDDHGIPPTVAIQAPSSAVNGEQIAITVNAADDVALLQTTLALNGSVVATFTQPSYTYTYTVPNGVTSIAVHAVATDVAGSTSVADVQVAVHSDPLTTLSGVVRTAGGQRVAGARVRSGSLSATADANGIYTLSSIGTLQPVGVSASGRVGGTFLSGSITVSTFVRGGTTSADISVDLPAPGTASSVTLAGYANAVRVAGRYAFVAAGSGGLEVVDLDDSTNLTVVTTLPLAGQINDVRLAGNRAYLAAGAAGVHVVDITTPLLPQLVATVATPGNALELSLAGGYLYVADGPAGIQVLSIAGSPAVAGALATTTSVIHVSAAASRLAFATDDGVLHFADVSQPVTPVERHTQSLGTVQALIMRGTELDVLDYSQYSIYAIDDPAAPRLVGQSSIYGNDMAILGFSAAITNSAYVTIFDLRNPSSPTQGDSYSWNNFSQGNATGIDLDGEFAYVTVDDNGSAGPPMATGQTRLVVIRHSIISDSRGVPPSVQLLSPSNNAVIVSQSTATLTASASDDVGVAIVHFLVNGTEVGAATAAPFQISWSVPNPGTYTIQAVAVDYGNNTAQTAPITVQVIADPLTTVAGVVRTLASAPVAGAVVELNSTFVQAGADGSFQFSSVPTTGGAFTVHASGRVIGEMQTGTAGPVQAVLGGTTRIDVVVAPPALGVLGSTQLIRGGAQHLAVVGGTAFVASNSGVELLDIRLPTMPRSLGTIPWALSAENLVTNGTQLFIAAGNEGVHLADITTPAAPVRISTLAMPSFAHDVALGPNGLVFIADDVAGLQIADFSNPQSPAIRATLAIPNGALNVAYSNGYALVAPLVMIQGSSAANTWLYVVDVHQPTAPAIVGSVSFGGDVRRVAVSGTTAYVAAGNGGLVVIDFSNPALPVITAVNYNAPQPNDLAINGNALVVAGGYQVIVGILDITNGGATLARAYSVPPLTSDAGRGVALDGELAAVILQDYNSGLYYLAIIKYRTASGSLSALQRPRPEVIARR